jgi:phosphoglycolate phosphatase-like HAD superfamily hydrolase
VQPTILLFDLDGTLVDTGGAGRRAIERAFAERHGRPDACASIRFSGMTDRAIVREALRAIDARDDDASIDALLATYVGLLEGEVRRSERYRVLEGVVAMLDACAARARTALGLGTGNVREGAATKLGRASLFERFAFGGFGCDAEDRAELLSVGASRGAAWLGEPLDACRVVVIGDTPKDIAAAHAIGAECLAVATGTFGEDALRAHAPALVVPSLAAPGAREVLLG